MALPHRATCRPRPVMLGAVALMHLAAIMWLFLSAAEPPRPQPRRITMIALSPERQDPAPAPAPAPAPRPVPHTVPETAPPAVVPIIASVAADLPVAPPQAPAAPASAGECAPLALLGAALASDEAVAAAILLTPPPARSVADAIVVWNAGWSDVAKSAKSPLAPVRVTVEHVLATLQPSCINLPIAGPRLVLLPSRRGTTILVFGSGTWNWRQLLVPEISSAN